MFPHRWKMNPNNQEQHDEPPQQLSNTNAVAILTDMTVNRSNTTVWFCLSQQTIDLSLQKVMQQRVTTTNTNSLLSKLQTAKFYGNSHQWWLGSKRREFSLLVVLPQTLVLQFQARHARWINPPFANGLIRSLVAQRLQFCSF